MHVTHYPAGKRCKICENAWDEEKEESKETSTISAAPPTIAFEKIHSLLLWIRWECFHKECASGKQSTREWISRDVKER